ncbi:MAG TPA: hypothetical protein VM529_24965 [Gemmata sp.]|nr:hypothetical protein [Gemmata sp.]
MDTDKLKKLANYLAYVVVTAAALLLYQWVSRVTGVTLPPPPPAPILVVGPDGQSVKVTVVRPE